MVDDFMVCVDRIIALAACFESSSSVNEKQPNSTTTTIVNNSTNVVSLKKTSVDDENEEEEEEGKKSYCSKKMKEMVECRICQEEDDLVSLEALCAYNGTLKEFSPNYSLPPTSSPNVLAIDIRQAWSPHIDIRDSHLLVLTASQSQLLQSEYENYVAANSGSLACLHSVALILLIILLLRQALMLTRDSGMMQESSAFINTELEFRSSVSGFASPICWLSSTMLCDGSHMVLTKSKEETG
ncbi:hypothetical protein REPUB_Repub20aG0001700 [Reevesia pubescens]